MCDVNARNFPASIKIARNNFCRDKTPIYISYAAPCVAKRVKGGFQAKKKGNAPRITAKLARELVPRRLMYTGRKISFHVKIGQTHYEKSITRSVTKVNPAEAKN